MTEEFLSRRELRARESLANPQVSSIEASEAFSEPEPQPEPVVEPPVEPDLVPSRRALRDREKAIQDILDSRRDLAVKPVELPRLNIDLPPIAPAVIEQPQARPELVVAPEPIFIPEPVLYEPVVEQPVAPAAPISPVSPAASVEAPNRVYTSPTPVFTDDANPGSIPTQIITREVSTDTATIVLPAIPDLTNNTISIPNSNLIIRTGAIDLPNVEAMSESSLSEPRTVTGPIQLITEAAQADSSLRTEVAGQSYTGIEPIPARGLKANGKEQVFPSPLKKGMGSVYTVVSIGLGMLTLGMLALAAFMLGFLD